MQLARFLDSIWVEMELAIHIELQECMTRRTTG
jgi:hypothetical protein